MELRALGGRRHQAGPGFPVKIPQPGLGTRDGRTKVGGRGLGSEGLSRGCCLPLGKDARDASVVWGLGSRAHTAFRLRGESSVVRAAAAWGVVVVWTASESCKGLLSLSIQLQVLSVATCYLSDRLRLLKPTLTPLQAPARLRALHVLCSLPDALPPLPSKPLLSEVSPALM